MRVLLISTSSGSRGGGELWLLYLAQGLKDRGHEVALWASSHESMDELCNKFMRIGRVLRANYTNTYQRKLRVFSLSQPRLIDYIKQQWLEWEPDILHLNKQNLEDGLDLISLISSLHIPSICMIHITQSSHWLGARLGWLRDYVSRLYLNRYPGLFVTTPINRAKDLASFLQCDLKKIKVVHNAAPSIDLETRRNWRSKYRFQLNLKEDQLLFVSVGRLVDQKQPFKFLEASSAILSKLPRSKFIWIGDGNLRNKWDQKITELGLSFTIQCLGWQDDVLPWLAAADFYLHTAKYEGMPFSILEALSVGLPCLVAETIRNEILEFQADAILPLEITFPQINEIASPAIRDKLSLMSLQLFQEKFTIEHMAHSYENLYILQIQNQKLKID